MIGEAEANHWAQTFGVDLTQVRRDHLISHILAVLPEVLGLADAVFIGGTALCRTHLDGLRMSEDRPALNGKRERCRCLHVSSHACCGGSIQTSPLTRRRRSRGGDRCESLRPRFHQSKFNSFVGRRRTRP